MNNSISMQEVFDRRLSGVRVEPKHWQQMLSTLRGEPVVKKKLSSILVFAIVTVLIAGVALAAVTLQGTGKQILQTEQTEGYYEGWTAETKASLVKELAELEYIEKTPDVKRLIADEVTSMDEMNRIADEAMTAFTGVDVSEISFLIIMNAAWGPFDSWNTEQQAWYSQLQVELGLHRDGITRFVLPTGTIDRDTAVALARAAIAKGYDVDESTLDSYRLMTSFQVPEFSDDDKAYWYVGYEKPSSISDEDALFYLLEIYIDPDTGELLESVEDKLAFRDDLQAYLDAIDNNPLMIDIKAYMEANGLKMNPFSWSLETFADWSTHFHERGLKQLAQNPELFSSYLPAILTYAYSLPDDQAISQADALAIAQDAIVTQIGRSADEVVFYSQQITILYDVTDPANPLWKFYFKKPSTYNSDAAFSKQVESYYGSDVNRLPNLKVEVNAYTGEVVRAFTIDFTYDYTNDPNGDGLSDFSIALNMQAF